MLLDGEVERRLVLLLASSFRNIRKLSWGEGGLELHVEPVHTPLLVVKGYTGSALVLLNGQPYYSLDGYHKYVPLPAGSSRVRVVFSPYLAFGEKVDVNLGEPYYVEVVGEAFGLWVRLKMVHELRRLTQDEDLRGELSQTLKETLGMSRFKGVTRLQLEVANEFDRVPDELLRVIPDEYTEGAVDGEYSEALNYLRMRLAELRAKYGKRGRIYALAHAHIDAAWLWNFDETRRKVARTFATVLTLMDEFDFKYIQSSAQYYEWIREDNPQLFSRIRQRVEEGRWLLGAGWVESDTNMLTLESLVRQLLYSQRFYLEHFGRIAHILWLPDSFGFSANLPQIARLADIDVFATHKVFWNTVNRFPYSVFSWVGVDGSEITAVAFGNGRGGYNSTFSVGELIEQWRNWSDKANPMVYSYGYGDGGGGPTREMLMRAEAVEELPILPSVTHGLGDFKPAERWRGELYLETHQGVFTSHSNMKRLNTAAEAWLREAEIWSTIAGRSANTAELWRRVLKNQFHDVLPGSAIREVYETVYPEMEDIVAKAKLMALESALSLVEGGEVPVGFNSLNWEREEYVVFEGKTYKAKLPPLGFAPLVEAEGQVYVAEDEHTLMIENQHLRLGVNKQTGKITTLYDKDHSREVLSAESNEFVFYENIPGWADAWNIEQDFESFGSTPTLCGMEVQRGLEATVKLAFRFRNSEVHEKIVVYPDSKWVDVYVSTAMKDRELLLKLWNHFDVNAEKATFEVPGASVERPTHKNTSWDKAKWEVPMLRWVSLDEGDYGVAVLSDYKHGVSVKGGSVGVSITKTPIYPDPYTDTESIETHMRIYPHTGTWRQAEVYKRAYEMTTPIITVKASPQKKSFLKCDQLVLEAIKQPEEGRGVILRLYDPLNVRGKAKIRVWFTPTKAAKTDLVELKELDSLKVNQDQVEVGYTNFEVVTIRIE